MKKSGLPAWIALPAALALVAAFFSAVVATGTGQFNFGQLTRVAGSSSSLGGDPGRYAALVEDAAGGQHLAYYEALFGDLRYAHRVAPGGPWSVETVDSAGDVGLHASIAIGDKAVDQGLADVVASSRFVDVVTTTGLSTRMIGGRFRADAIDPTWYSIVDVVPDQNRLELAALFAGPTTTSTLYSIDYYQPVIAYQDATSTWGLKVARPAPGGGWTLDLVDSTDATTSSAARTGFYTSVGLDSLGHIHLAWQDRTSLFGDTGRLRYAYFDGTAWTKDLVDPTSQRGSYARLVVDSSDRPLIFYRDDLNRDFYLALNNGPTSWTQQILDASGNQGVAISADYFPAGNQIVAAWQDAPTTLAGPGTVRIGQGGLTSTTLSWITADLATSPALGSYTGIAFGTTTGTLHVTFYDEARHRLLFTSTAGGPSSFTTPRVLDSGSQDVGRYCSADVDPVNDDLYAANYDAGRHALRLARFDGATTSSEFVDGLKAGEFSDIGLTSTEVIVPYHDETAGTLRVARWPRGGVPVDGTDELVDGASSDVGEYVSMAIDDDDRIYLAYYDRANTNLRAAIYANATWYDYLLVGEAAGTADTQHVGEFCDLTLNPNRDKLGLVFYDAVAQNPVYGIAAVPAAATTNTTVTFIGGVIVNGNRFGRYCSAAFDTSNTLFVASFNDDTLHPVVATVGTSGTTVVEVESEILHVSGWHTSIAIDPATGRPALAYYDATNSSLKYAAQNPDGTWDVSELDLQGNTGLYPDLLFDPVLDQVYIAYYDASFGGMRLIARLGQQGSVWKTPVTLTKDRLGLRPALTADEDGKLSMCFYDQPGGDLYTFATQGAPVLNATRASWLDYR